MWIKMQDGDLLNMESVTYVEKGESDDTPCIEFTTIGNTNVTLSTTFETDEARDLAYTKIVDGLKMRHLGVLFLG